MDRKKPKKADFEVNAAPDSISKSQNIISDSNNVETPISIKKHKEKNL